MLRLVVLPAPQPVPAESSGRARRPYRQAWRTPVQPKASSEHYSVGAAQQQKVGAGGKNVLPGSPPGPKLGSVHVVPMRTTKTVLFIRHGQGFHNVAGDIDFTNYDKEEWFDAHLTPLGWSQAAALRRFLRKQEEALPIAVPELIVVSPLMRTLETAVGAFRPDASQLSTPGHHVQRGHRRLMAARDGVPGVRVARKEVWADARTPPFVAHELCRETLGVHPCDRRRRISEYKALFPGVDFSLIENEEDVLWDKNLREPDDAVAARGERFMRWLLTRKEHTIAVVTHSSFMNVIFTRLVSEDCPDEALSQLQRWPNNCELRACTLVGKVPMGSAEHPIDFPGGMHGLTTGINDEDFDMNDDDDDDDACAVSGSSGWHPGVGGPPPPVASSSGAGLVAGEGVGVEAQQRGGEGGAEWSLSDCADRTVNVECGGDAEAGGGNGGKDAGAASSAANGTAAKTAANRNGNGRGASAAAAAAAVVGVVSPS